MEENLVIRKKIREEKTKEKLQESLTVTLYTLQNTRYRNALPTQKLGYQGL